jgi:aminoglycoside phosphotransferase (APT) family kinase protein
VSGPHEDRTRAVAERLGELLGGQAVAPRRLSGGASRESWTFDLAARDTAPRPLLLQADRVAPAERPGLGASPAQAPLLRAASAAGVPVAAVVADGEDDPVLGPRWIVVERLPGTADPAKIVSGDGVPPAAALLDELAAAAAAIHRIEASDGLRSIDDPLALLRSLSDELGQPHPVFELALCELEAKRPPGAERRTVVHGDFRAGNLLVAPDGLKAVLDWELTHLGDPLEDLGWFCIRAWRFGRPERPAGGLGSREELASAYERHAGLAVDRDALRWWELYGTLRWGLICVMQAFTHLSGAARSLEHAVIGRRACEVEWDLLDLLDPGGAVPAPAPAPEPEAAPALHDRPTAHELLEAVRSALGDDVLPLLDGRAAFEVRVSLRALGIVDRELARAPVHDAAHAAALESLGVPDEDALAAAVRSGSLDERRSELLSALRVIVAAKLEAANPKHLRPIASQAEEVSA